MATSINKQSRIIKLLDPRRLLPSAVGGAATLLAFLLPPIASVQVHLAEKLFLRAVAPAAAFVITLLFAATKRSIGRVLIRSVAVTFIVISMFSGIVWRITTNPGRSASQVAAGWSTTVDERFAKSQELKTAAANQNGEGNAATGDGILTIRLRSTHVANQQYLRFDAAPAGGEYYVETRVRRQYGPVGSGCFLALGVLDSDRFYLFTVTDDAKPGVDLHSARVDQEVSANPAVEKPVDHSNELPYVRYWSLLFPPGKDASWTRIAVHRLGDSYDFFVDDRLVSHVTGLPVPNEKVSVGAYDPGTTDGSYVGCQFKYLRARTP
jgi:hypothetical protein